MTSQETLDLLYNKELDPLEKMFEELTCPPISYFFTPQEVDYLYKIATSIDLCAKVKVKYKLIDSILRPKGFVRLHAGTNRIVYRHLDFTNFVAKIAIDDKGLGDNPAEFENQKYLKPYVTKTFEVVPNGVLAFSERVDPITSLTSFLLISREVYDIIVFKFIGVFVIDDIGSDYFMNWGVRKGVGPCLLDYPYVYKLDSNKLFCNKPIYPNTKFPICGGEIDYDEGFNNLVCTKCGKHFIAKDLAKAVENNLIIFKGGLGMINVDACIRIYEDGKLVTPCFNETDSIEKKTWFGKDLDYHNTEPAIVFIDEEEIMPVRRDIEIDDDDIASIVLIEDEELEELVQTKPVEQEYNECNEIAKENTFVESEGIIPPTIEDEEIIKATVDINELGQPIPKVIIQEETGKVYDLESTEEITNAKSKDLPGYTFMSGIGVNTICGIVSGMSDESRKALEEQARIEAAAKEAEENAKVEDINIEEFVNLPEENQLEVFQEASDDKEDEPVDLSKLINFKPGIEDSNKEATVYRTSESEDKFRNETVEHRKFFRWLDKRLSFMFDRYVNEGKSSAETFNLLVEIVRDKTAEKHFFKIKPEDYVEAFMKNTSHILTIDTFDEIDDEVLNKY